MGYYEFPNTRNYDSDLGFLIKKYKELGNDYKDLVNKYELLQKIYEQIKEDIEDITKEQLQEWLDDGTLTNLILTLGKVITYYDTTNELKTANNLVLNQIIRTSGYYTKNDNNGGLFLVSNEPLGFNIYNGTYYINLIEDTSSIELRKCGIQENMDISNILNDISDYYTTFIFPNGTYLINSTVSFSNQVLIKGNNTTIKTSNTIGYIFKSGNISLTDIKFIGNGQPETNDENGIVAIEILNADSVYINNCIFTQFNKNIEITNSSNVAIQNTIISKAYETLNKINGYGILFENTTNGKIINCDMSEIERHCIYINECTNIEINNNNLVGQTTNYQRFSNYEGNIKINGSKSVIVTNNTIEGNYYAISLLKSFSNDFGCSYIEISNNICKNIIKGYSFIRGFIGIIEDGNYSFIKIHDNYLYNDTKNSNTRGIVLDYGTVSNIEIYNNTVINVGTGIRIIKLNPIKVDNNTVINCDLGYDFSTNSLQIYGNYNYYNNCNTSCNGSLIHLSGCILKGFINNNNPTSQVSSVINANTNNLFIATSTATEITNITGGATTQEITIISEYVNGAKLIADSLPSYIKINSDFTSKGTITLVKQNTTWFEKCRTVLS